MLLLGSVIFDDFSLPENVKGLLSGKQVLAAKKQIGGQRTIDAMGPDPDDITWSGRFQGGDVVGKAQPIADMRDAGQSVPLICDTVVLTVLIADFKLSYERPYQATYEITLMVLPDQVDSGGADQSLDGLVGSDMQSSNAIAGGSVSGAAPSGGAATVPTSTSGTSSVFSTA